MYGREESERNPHYRMQQFSKQKNSAMASIMTRDWTNEAATMEVGLKIQDLDNSLALRYKPDIFTTLEIYR